MKKEGTKSTLLKEKLEKIIKSSLFLEYDQKDWVLKQIDTLSEDEQKELLGIFEDDSKRGGEFLRKTLEIDPDFIKKYKQYSRKVEKKFHQDLEEREKAKEGPEEILKELE